MSVRWVITPKVINEVPSTKARLCAKGFREHQDAQIHQHAVMKV